MWRFSNDGNHTITLPCQQHNFTNGVAASGRIGSNERVADNSDQLDSRAVQAQLNASAIRDRLIHIGSDVDCREFFLRLNGPTTLYSRPLTDTAAPGKIAFNTRKRKPWSRIGVAPWPSRANRNIITAIRNISVNYTDKSITLLLFRTSRLM